MVWVKEGQIFVSDPTEGDLPAMLLPGDGLAVFVNGHRVEGAVEVRAADKITVTPVEDVEPGHCTVMIDDNGLVARVDIKPETRRTYTIPDQPPAPELRLAGEPQVTPFYSITHEDLMRILGEHGVTTGIQEENIRRILAQPRAGLYVVAEGRPPKPPVDERVEILFKEGEKGRPLVRADDSVDFYELQSFPSIRQGERLAVKHPAVPGEDGVKVTGEVLQVPEPKAMILQAGPGAEIINEGFAAVAAISGRPSWSRRGNVYRFEVARVLECNGDVSLETGNIRFVGDVKVTGSVQEGMVVQADGNIEIMGNVAEATVQARADVLIHGHVFSSNVRAGGEGAHLGKFLESLNELTEQVTGALVATRQLVAAGQGKLEPGRAFLVVMDQKFPRIPNLVRKLQKMEAETKAAKLSVPETLTATINELAQTFLNIHVATVDNIAVFISLLNNLRAATAEVEAVVGDRHSVTASSVASSVVEATGDIIVATQGAWNSTLHAGGDVKVAGQFRGGKINAKGEVWLSKAGSERGMSKAEISLGTGGKLRIDAAYPVIIVRIGNRATTIEKPLRNVKASLDEREGIIDLVGLSL